MRISRTHQSGCDKQVQKNKHTYIVIKMYETRYDGGDMIEKKVKLR